MLVYYYCKFLYIYGKKCTKYLHGTWSLLNILLVFWHKRKIDNFDAMQCNVFLAIAANISQRLKTGFVVQGYIWLWPRTCTDTHISTLSSGLLFSRAQITHTRDVVHARVCTCAKTGHHMNSVHRHQFWSWLITSRRPFKSQSRTLTREEYFNFKTRTDHQVNTWRTSLFKMSPI